MSQHKLKFSIFMAFVVICAAALMAQDSDDIQQGIKAYGTYHGGDIDSISMTNGNLTLEIPLISYPQRGKAHLGWELVYNNKNYFEKTICAGDTCTVYWNLKTLDSPLHWVSDRGYTEKVTTITETGTKVGFSYFSLVSPDGASHIMAQQSSNKYESVDGTGLSINPLFLDAEGFAYSSTGMSEDPNGNQPTSSTTGKDTVGRSIPGVSSGNIANCPSGPLPAYSASSWGVPGPSGGTSVFLLCNAQVNVVTSYDVTDGTQVSHNLSYLQSITLPNGTSWIFQYSNDGNGDLTQITLPTGGTISYVWSGISGCSTPIPPRWAISRTVNANDGMGNHTWNYSYVLMLGKGANSTTTVTDPLNNQTVYTNTNLSACSAYTTAVQYYQGPAQPANLLKTVSTTYSSSVSPFSASLGTDVMNVVPAQITTTWPNGKTSAVTKTYDSGFTFPSPRYNDPTQYTGLYGRITVQKEYDYGNGQPGPLLKQTNTSYAWQSPNPNYASYLSNNMLNLVYSVQVTDGTSQKAYTQYGHDETALISSGLGSAQNLDTAPWTGTYRGNVTSVNRWLNLPTAQTLSTTTTHYDTGMASVTKDPLLNPTTYQYSSTFQDAYVTQVTNALNQSTYLNPDYNTGLLTSTTDLNGQLTSDTYDVQWRLTNVTRPTGGGQTSFCYSDVGGPSCLQGSPPYNVVVTKSITSAANKTETAIVDGLGRLAHSQLNSDPEGINYIDTTYDAVGNKATGTNPYRTTSDSTYGTTNITYDALHRATQTTEPDGSPIKTAYCANTTLVTDEAGHWRRSTVDGLGRLIEVDEPNSPTATVNANGCPGTNEPIWVTTYSYDTLGNVISVLQAGSRQRTFTYDSLSRLLTATNPESGQLLYTYDADGNVTTKVTPTQNQSNASNTTTITYCYDSLNRLTAKGYGSSQQACTNGSMPNPTATYSYDGSSCLGQASCYNIGRRTGMTDTAGSESWAYDAMGRPVVQSRKTNNVTKTTSYTYNLDGSVATLTYPSGRVITYTPNTAGRPSNVQDNTTSVYYTTGTCSNGIPGDEIPGTGVCYAPQGAVALLQNGSSLVSTHIYSNRLQPCWMYSTTGTALAWNTTLCNGTDNTPGNLLDLKYNFSLGTDNGNLTAITNNRVSDRSQSFTYDQLNRIATAQTTATGSSDPAHCWGQAFGYDSTGDWSNLLSISGVSSAYGGCTQGSLSVSVNSSNQIVGDTYDAAGNTWVVPGTGGATYTYNAENQMTATSNSSTQYIYDGDGNRVEKSGSKIYWYGGTEVLDETDTTGSTTNANFNEYVFFGSARIARRDSSGNVFYYLADHLGTSRVIAEVPSGQTTATLCYDADFEPFGIEHAYTNTCVQNYKFTGKERDAESGLDMFGARYYGSSLGRFMTPDWAAKPTAVPYAMFGNPQSLNLYSYVNNNPTTTRDPDGHAEWYDTNGRHLGTDGVNDGGVVIQKASAVSYSSDHSLVDVAGSGFPVASFSRAEGNAIQSSVDRTLAPAGGDTKGGFHEEGFTADASGIHNAAPGPAYQQGDATAHINQTINSTTTMEEHTHPVGTQDTAGSTTIGGTHFDPTPSPQDIHGAAGHDNITHVEASAGTSTVYVYNSSGVQAHVPLSVFPRPKKDDQ